MQDLDGAEALVDPAEFQYGGHGVFLPVLVARGPLAARPFTAGLFAARPFTAGPFTVRLSPPDRRPPGRGVRRGRARAGCALP
ncbi:hypothetical protein GCM10018953_69950 [Streptosporangium nondiastaticum]